MGDLERARAARRIEIGVHHASGAAELKLETGPFTDLERRRSEAANQLLGRQAAEAVLLLWLRLNDGGGLRGLLRASGTASQERDEREGE